MLFVVCGGGGGWSLGIRAVSRGLRVLVKGLGFKVGYNTRN